MNIPRFFLTTILGFAAVLMLVGPASAVARKGEPTSLAILEDGRGDYPVPELRHLPTDQQLTPIVYLGDASSFADPLNTTYTIEGAEVVLRDGRCEKAAEPGSATRTLTLIFGAPAFADLDGDGDEDAAILLTHNPGGSGTFYYVAAALNDNGRFLGTEAVFLGDRIQPLDLQIKKSLVLARYQDRGSQEPMSAFPTLEKSVRLSLENGRLAALNPLLTSEQILAGWVTIGHEVRSFQTCPPAVEYWLAGNSPALAEIKAEYRSSSPGERPYTPLFMVLAGSSVKPSTDGFGAEHQSAFRASQFVMVRPTGGCQSDAIVVDAPFPGETIRSPLKISGRARGSWFFEGDFPVVLQGRKGDVIAIGFAKATSEWMTNDFVSFTGLLTFETPQDIDSGFLLFKKNNPSDRTELDAEMSFFVFLK